METASRSAPDWAEARIASQHAERALELCDERNSELGIGSSRLEEGSVIQLALSIDTDGGDHFSASRARAMAPAAGTMGGRVPQQ
jgi:hypothetical protein